jgi:hypothetical protein
MKTLFNAIGAVIVIISPLFLVTGLITFVQSEMARVAEPDTKRYSVTIYSGGEAVEYWVVDQMPQIDGDNQVTHIQGGRIIIGGPVVIQPHSPRKPY